MQGKQTWSDCSGLPGMRHVRFKGGQTQTTIRNIPAQTAQEAALQTGLFNYGTAGLNNATNYQNQANSALGNVINLDWNKAFGGYTDTMNGVNSGYAGLLSGNLPSNFSTARQTALNNDLQGTVGNAINNLGNRGILNSSVTNSALNNISQNAANTLANNYTTDINTYSNILGNTANNATNQLNTSAQAQQNSYYVPNQLFNYANNSLSTGQNLFNTLYGGRMGTGGSTTTQSGDNSGAWGALGSLGSAAIIACFAAGTMISTPDGEKPIEEINIGDKVLSFDFNNKIIVETVKEVSTPVKCSVVLVKTKESTVKTTPTQRFLTEFGHKYVENCPGYNIYTKNGKTVIVSTEPQPEEIVYDFTVSGRNIFFANGIAVEGWD